MPFLTPPFSVSLFSSPLSTPENQKKQYDNQLLQLFTSSLYIAGIFASLFAGSFCRVAGRRAAIAFSGLAFCLGAALSAGAVHIAMVVVGRVLLGVGVGIGNTVRRMKREREREREREEQNNSKNNATQNSSKYKNTPKPP